MNDTPIPPPLDDCRHCGHPAIYINRRACDFIAQCGRWRSVRASAEIDCSMTTGSYRTAIEAAEVWNRRADKPQG